MFTNQQIASVARAASLAVEGSGSGHTEHRKDRAMGRYIVGGLTPAATFPIGEARPVIREAIRRMLDSRVGGVETLGYWEDNGAVYVDLGDTWTSRARAINMARARGELAIFDRETGECIPTPPAFGALAG